MASLPPITLHPEQPVLKETIDTDTDQRCLEFTVYLPPKPLQRPLFVGRVSRVVNRDATPLRTFTERVVKLLKNKTLSYFAMEIPVRVVIIFRLRRPNDHFVAKNRTRKVREDKKQCRVTGGDVDNYAKFVLDAMNKVLYQDDRQVMALTAIKTWCEDPNSQGSTTVALAKFHSS